MPKLFNKHHNDAPGNAIYIGRGSPYGNPFVLGTDGTREEVIAKFRQKIVESPKKDFIVDSIRKSLKGKDLVCFCAPAACHGDVVLEIANSEGEWPPHRTVTGRIPSKPEMQGLPVPTSTPPMPACKSAFPKESLPALLKVIDDEIEYNTDALKKYADNKPTHALLTNKNFHLQIMRTWILEQQ